MAKKPLIYQDYDKLEIYGSILNIALTHPEIKPRLEELGFDESRYQ